DEKIRVTSQVFLEQIDAAAVQGHRRCVGKPDASLRIHLENRPLPRRVASVRFDHDVDGREQLAGVVVHAGAKAQDEGGALDAQRVRRSAESIVGDRWWAKNRMQHLRGGDLSLKARSP